MKAAGKAARLPHVAALAALLAAAPALADEGMWTFDAFPAARVQAAYGFTPSREWLDHLRLSALRIAGGCSASAVSPSGLVMTNHHCVRECVENLSTRAKRDYGRDGFVARRLEDEQNCAGMEIDQLVETSDVTARVTAATAGLDPTRFAPAQRAAIAALERECASADAFHCEVVTLYQGGRYDLYRYKRFRDVRLAFAAEDGIADFGGDPDNFNFPRYALDAAFLRIYGGDGRPQPMADWLAWSDGSIREGEPTFVAGNPGRTSRAYTLAEFENERDVVLPARLVHIAELRGFLAQYQQRGAEQKRHASDLLLGTENWLKLSRGQQAALADRRFFAQLAADEDKLRAQIAARPDLAANADAWANVSALVDRQRAMRTEYNALERGFVSELFEMARGLVRYGEEAGKPDGERLKEYSDARLPEFRQKILAQRSVHDELEIATLAWSLDKVREELGADHPVVRRVFGKRSPMQIAVAAVRGSRLKEIRTDRAGQATGGYRKALYDGGKAAIEASDDPMIVLARAFEADTRSVRRRYEDEVEGPMRQQHERLAKARFALSGTDTYPDATFTLRLSYGAVAGYTLPAGRVQPFTTLGGAFARHTGAEPFALPPSWLRAQGKLRPGLPFDFTTTNDIIGGNSGSPVVDRQGRVVGLVFDGNIESLGGDYGFDGTVNRSVAVHSAAIVEALDKVYGATRLVDEIVGKAARR